jgi:hypothetical protein
MQMQTTLMVTVASHLTITYCFLRPGCPRFTQWPQQLLSALCPTFPPSHTEPTLMLQPGIITTAPCGHVVHRTTDAVVTLTAHLTLTE